MKKIFLLLVLAVSLTSCESDRIKEMSADYPFIVKSVTREDYYDDGGNLLPTTYLYVISNNSDTWELRTAKIYAVNDTIEIRKK